MRKLLILLVFCACISCTGHDNYVVFSGYAQGGTYTVKANLKGVRTPVPEIRDSIGSILGQIDFTLSGYNRNSLLSRFNEGADIEPNAMFTDISTISGRMCEETSGAFDVWAAPLFDIWGFGFKSGEFPTDDMVEDAMKLCKEHKVLNFNAIAQGYSCDVVARYLQSIGVEDMLVDIGEIYCSGLNPSGKGWSIGIDNPVDGNNTPGADIRAVWTSDGNACGIVTSGNYRKFYIKDGKKYSHTVDPRTGRPVDHDLLSATIVAPTAAQADAYATACMVMGMQEAREFIESRDDIEGYLIGASSTWTSEGFRIRD